MALFRREVSGQLSAQSRASLDSLLVSIGIVGAVEAVSFVVDPATGATTWNARTAVKADAKACAVGALVELDADDLKA